ncbi:MAG: S53 family peptidase [Terracidiphilus sp.]|jgi:subtilase family serine protease
MLERLPRFVATSKAFRGIRIIPALTTAGLAPFLFTTLSPAQARQSPAPHTLIATARTVVIPASSHAVASDLGLRAHTNVRFIVPENLSPNEAPPFSGFGYETPASLACLYHVVKPIPGCNPNSTINTPSGGSQTIAIVDAYDDPNAAADLAFFSAQFGIPFSPSKFHVVYAGGSQPPEDPTGGWEVEESLDIEYSHAMAPNATLYLVEANSNFNSDLYAAVLVASNLVACGQATTCPAHSKGRGEVSMSWGGGEFTQETELDSFFTTPGVVYFASAGDSPGVIYPCASPNVVCAGGTSTARNEYTGNLIAEIAWSDAGGGISQVEPIPSYQASNRGVARQLNGFRGVPDISSDSNPNTGLWVWDTFPVDGSETGWFIVGGTSAASPTLAGITNASGQFASSSVVELSTLYGLGSFGSFNDIIYGACGYYSGTFSNLGWDLCTGFGSPNLGGR